MTKNFIVKIYKLKIEFKEENYTIIDIKDIISLF